MSSEGPSDQLTLWPGVSPVSLIPSPGPAGESKTNDTSGQSSSGLSASYDLLGLSLRMCLVSVLPQPMRSSATWRRAATPSGRLWWVLAISGLPTSDDECSSSLEWPTAPAQPYGTSNNGCPGDRWTTPQAQDAKQDTGPPSSQDRDLLASEVRRWPTARAEDSECAGAHVERGTAETLTAAARMWPTATAVHDGGSRAGTPRASKDAKAHPGTSLLDAVTGQWATPGTAPGGSVNEPLEKWEARRRKKEAEGIHLHRPLHIQAQAWATPSSQDAKNDTFPKSQEERKGGTLPSQFMQLGLHRPASPSGNGKSRGWPTACAQDAGDSPNLTPEAHEERQARKKAANPNLNELHKPLAVVVREQWPTAHGMDNEGNPRRNGPTGNELGRAVTREWRTASASDCDRGVHPCPDKKAGQHSLVTQVKAPRGTLNPKWVLQLMGFPKDWLDSVPPIAVRRSRRSATRSSRK